MAAYSITAEELVDQRVAALKAKGIELGMPLSDEAADRLGQLMAGTDDPDELPTSQAETDRVCDFKDMPAEQFEELAKMVNGGADPAAEEMMAQTIAAVKAKGIELGQPLSDEDAPAFVAALTSMPIGKMVAPESQAEMDRMLGELRDMPKEVFEQIKVVAAKRAGKITAEQAVKMMADKTFSITAEELVDQTVAAFKVRAAELGQTLSEEDAALLTSSMGQASTTLPESQAEVDEKLGQIKDMSGADFEGMITMVKGMAA